MTGRFFFSHLDPNSSKYISDGTGTRPALEVRTVERMEYESGQERVGNNIVEGFARKSLDESVGRCLRAVGSNEFWPEWM